MGKPLQGLEAKELSWRDSHCAMVEHFGKTEQETQPAPLLELVPMQQDEFTAKLARAGFSVPVSARSENKRLQEDAAIAADLAYQRLKDTGQLRRDEDHRALVAQVNFGDAL